MRNFREIATFQRVQSLETFEGSTTFLVIRSDLLFLVKFYPFHLLDSLRCLCRATQKSVLPALKFSRT